MGSRNLISNRKRENHRFPASLQVSWSQKLDATFSESTFAYHRGPPEEPTTNRYIGKLGPQKIDR